LGPSRVGKKRPVARAKTSPVSRSSRVPSSSRYFSDCLTAGAAEQRTLDRRGFHVAHAQLARPVRATGVAHRRARQHLVEIGGHDAPVGALGRSLRSAEAR
jgi:hypothetical protein